MKTPAPVKGREVVPAVPPFLARRPAWLRRSRWDDRIPDDNGGAPARTSGPNGRSPGRLERELRRASVGPGSQSRPRLPGDFHQPTFLRLSL